MTTPETALRNSSSVNKRQRWPWVVGALALLVVAAVVLLFLVPRAPSGPAYLTSTVGTTTVALTAQGTGTVADARVDSIGSDNSWTVTERDGQSTGAGVQGSSVHVYSVDVSVEQVVTAGQQLAVVYDDADQWTTITAPEDGVIRSSTALAGTVASGALFTLGVGGLRVVAPISEYDIADVAVGQTVDFTFDALGSTGTGTVSSIGQSAETQDQAATSTVTEYSVVSTIVEPPAGLRLDMSVQLSVAVESADDVLAVPVQALREDADGVYTVLRIDEDGLSEEVTVSVGLIGDSYAAVTKGLTGGDEVVIGTPGEGVVTDPFAGQPAVGGE